MNTSTFRQDLKQLFDRYPTARFVFIFLQSFAVFAVADCVLSLHMDWLFRAHVGELVGRSIFFAIIFSVAIPWFQKRQTPSSVSTPRA